MSDDFLNVGADYGFGVVVARAIVPMCPALYIFALNLRENWLTLLVAIGLEYP